MPDLSIEGVQQFWRDYKDKSIYRVISFLEAVESWVLDGDPEFEAAFERLARELDDVGKIDIAALKQEDLFIAIANSIRSGRTLRLLHVLDTAHPGAASKLLIYSEESSRNMDDAPGLFLRRNIVFERLRLLARVFTTERVNLVLQAIEGEEHEEYS